MEQPNILYILADDLGWADIGLHGAPIRTPNIDRLGREGVELTQHYACPMCTPTRASLLTGRYPSRFGAHATVPSNAPVLPDGYQTLATALRDAGYDTGLFGKWHLGSSPRYGPNEFGFNTAYGSLAGGVEASVGDGHMRAVRRQGFAHRPAQISRPAYHTGNASAQIE
jgi:arylsulfatase A-like enzyme